MSLLNELPTTGGTYEDFVGSLRGEPYTLTLSPERYMKALHIDAQTLARHARVHRNTIARAPGSQGVQKYLRESLRVVKAATDLNGDLNAALFWFRNEPLSVFSYKTAETLVSEGRADDVLRYVTSLEAGAAG